MAKFKRIRRRPWTTGEYTTLRKHSKDKAPVAKIAKAMKRTPSALRQQACKFGITLGHQT